MEIQQVHALEATDLIRGNVSIEHLYYALNICVRPGNICVQLAANSRNLQQLAAIHSKSEKNGESIHEPEKIGGKSA